MVFLNEGNHRTEIYQDVKNQVKSLILYAKKDSKFPDIFQEMTTDQ